VEVGFEIGTYLSRRGVSEREKREREKRDKKSYQ